MGTTMTKVDLLIRESVHDQKKIEIRFGVRLNMIEHSALVASSVLGAVSAFVASEE